MTQLSIMIALVVALALGTAAGDGGVTTQTGTKGINPVQHSE